MTAIRETFEETGLLLASATSSDSESESEVVPPPCLSDSDSEAALDASRESIHTGRTLFRDFLQQHALSADVKALLPFTEWITPLGPSRCVVSLFHLTFTPIQQTNRRPQHANNCTRTHAHCSRFHTRFYVAFLPSINASGFSFSSDVTQHRLPTPDGGREVVEARFVHPREALTEHRSKKIALMPPQHYILTTLAELLVGPETTQQQRQRVEQLSTGAFGRMVIRPQAGKRDANGRTPLVYEGDEARGGPRGRLHRSIVLFSPETKVGWSVVRPVLLNNADGCETRSFQQKSSYCVTLIFSLKSREMRPFGRQSYDLKYASGANQGNTVGAIGYRDI